MTQDNGECNDMNSAFQKLRIPSDESMRYLCSRLQVNFSIFPKVRNWAGVKGITRVRKLFLMTYSVYQLQ